jgi:hypothetical protein
MTDHTTDRLRAAVQRMTPRDRDALWAELTNSARRWEGALPDVAIVWSAMAALVHEVSTDQRARERAGA